MTAASFELMTTPPSIPALPELREVRHFVAESLAPSTRRAYKTGFGDFVVWTAERDLETLPASPEVVSAYLAARARQGLSVSTLQQRLAAIRWAHETQGLETPTAAKGVRSTMAGIRRSLGVAPKRKSPATVSRLAVMVSHAKGDGLKAIRDRALLLFGFASAMRRSELVSLTVDDIEEVERGMVVTLRRSKTDQEGHGHQRAIPFGRSELCPVRALKRWLGAAGITEGPLFRQVDRHGGVGGRLSAAAVGELVKSYAKRAGFDPRDFGGHSLRAGFVTSAAEKGASASRIMDHTGHKSVGMVRVYTRRVDAFAEHAGEGLL